MVINYPFICGNVPHVPSDGVYLSQLIRFCYIFSESKYFVSALKEFNEKLVGHGYVLNSLKRKFKVFMNRYLHLWYKFGVDMTSNEFLTHIF